MYSFEREQNLYRTNVGDIIIMAQEHVELYWSFLLTILRVSNRPQNINHMLVMSIAF